MNEFLRRVAQQRFLEQEAAIIATPPAALIGRCRVCGGHVRLPDRGYTIARSRVPVCTKCGGSAVAERLEAEDREAAFRAARTAQFLSLAGFNPQPQEQQMAKCATCEKPLFGKPVGDPPRCKACRDPEAGGGATTVPRKGKATKDVLKRFKIVATALDQDPDDLIGAFCEGWLERVRSSANFGNPG